MWEKDGVLYDNKSVKIENREFKFSSIIQAGLFQYRFELYHQIESVEKLSFIADNVVCGDAYIITGQSNSHASSNKSSYTSPFCRSFGVKTGYEKYTDEDKKISKTVHSNFSNFGPITYLQYPWLVLLL